MSDLVLNYDVLQLNKNWQAIGLITVRQAFEGLFSGSLKALKCDENGIEPLNVNDWILLEVRNGDDCVRTSHMEIRVPRVVITVRYDKLHILPPKLTLKNLRARDQDRCIYTGKKLRPEQMSIEHIVPTSKNGKHEWNNVALADRDINSWRGNRELKDLGLSPRFVPFAPRGRRPEEWIKNTHNFPEWDFFLKSA